MTETVIDLDTALERCGLFVILVDHDMFKSVPVDERLGKAVYDTRGIWPGARSSTTASRTSTANRRCR